MKTIRPEPPNEVGIDPQGTEGPRRLYVSATGCAPSPARRHQQRPRTEHRAIGYRGLPHTRSTTLRVTEEAGLRRRFPAGYLATVAVALWLGRSAPRP